MTRPYRYITRQRADVICPECAGPKFRQSKRCAECYYAARRRGEYPPPPVPARKAAKPKQAGPRRYAAQPQSHPWRRTNGLLKPYEMRAGRAG